MDDIPLHFTFQLYPQGLRPPELTKAWETDTLEAHRFAELFPMASAEDANRIARSIERDGFDLQTPVIVFEGKILDGRNRAAAARDVYRRTGNKDAIPRFSKFKGSEISALAYVRRNNLDLRSLTPTQKAVAASAMYAEYTALRRQAAPPRGGDESTGGLFDMDDGSGLESSEPPRPPKEQSAIAAAALTGASPRTTERVSYCDRHGPEALGAKEYAELAKQMRDGTMPAKKLEAIIREALRQKEAVKARAAAEEAAAALPVPTKPDPEQDAQEPPGRPVLVTPGASLYAVDAAELLESLDDRSVETLIVHAPPGLHAWDWWERVTSAAGEVVAARGEVWLIEETPTPELAARQFSGFTTREVFVATRPAGPGDLFEDRLIWVTHLVDDNDDEPTNLKPLQAVLGRSRVLRAGTLSAADLRHGRHPQQLPEALFRGLLATREGLVVDPFCGSGSSLVAAMELGRPVIAGDVVDEYLDAARLRSAEAIAAMDGDRQVDMFRPTADEREVGAQLADAALLSMNAAELLAYSGWDFVPEPGDEGLVEGPFPIDRSYRGYGRRTVWMFSGDDQARTWAVARAWLELRGITVSPYSEIDPRERDKPTRLGQDAWSRMRTDGRDGTVGADVGAAWPEVHEGLNGECTFIGVRLDFDCYSVASCRACGAETITVELVHGVPSWNPQALLCRRCLPGKPRPNASGHELMPPEDLEQKPIAKETQESDDTPAEPKDERIAQHRAALYQLQIVATEQLGWKLAPAPRRSTEDLVLLDDAITRSSIDAGATFDACERTAVVRLLSEVAPSSSLTQRGDLQPLIDTFGLDLERCLICHSRNLGETLDDPDCRDVADLKCRDCGYVVCVELDPDGVEHNANYVWNRLVPIVSTEGVAAGSDYLAGQPDDEYGLRQLIALAGLATERGEDEDAISVEIVEVICDELFSAGESPPAGEISRALGKLEWLRDRLTMLESCLRCGSSDVEAPPNDSQIRCRACEHTLALDVGNPWDIAADLLEDLAADGSVETMLEAIAQAQGCDGHGDLTILHAAEQAARGGLSSVDAVDLLAAELAKIGDRQKLDGTRGDAAVRLAARIAAAECDLEAWKGVLAAHHDVEALAVELCDAETLTPELNRRADWLVLRYAEQIIVHRGQENARHKSIRAGLEALEQNDLLDLSQAEARAVKRHAQDRLINLEQARRELFGPEPVKKGAKKSTAKKALRRKAEKAKKPAAKKPATKKTAAKKLPRVACPGCKRPVPLRKDGELREHAAVAGGEDKCEWSGSQPDALHAGGE